MQDMLGEIRQAVSCRVRVLGRLAGKTGLSRTTRSLEDQGPWWCELRAGEQVLGYVQAGGRKTGQVRKAVRNNQINLVVLRMT